MTKEGLATFEQAREIAELTTDICRNPDYEAETGAYTHVVVYMVDIGQVRVGTDTNPYWNKKGRADCSVTVREPIESTETGQLILQSDFSFFWKGVLRHRVEAYEPSRKYLQQDKGSDTLSPISKQIIIPFNTPRIERKQLTERKKEVDELSEAFHPAGFVKADYVKLKSVLEQFDTDNTIAAGEAASTYKVGWNKVW